MSANLNTLSQILKEYYLGPVAEQLNNEVLLLSRLESKSEDLVGKRAYVPLHYGRSTGIGARGESAALPAAGRQSYEKAVYDLKYLYGRVEVTGPSMAKTKNEAGAFLQALKSELDGVRNDLRKDLARQIYGNGTAVIATASGGTATTLVVPLEPLRKGQVYVGMRIGVKTSAGVDRANAGGATFTVASVDLTTSATTGTITVEEAVTSSGTTFASGDVIRRAGVTASAAVEANTYSLSDEVDGLQRIVSSSATNSLGGIGVTATSNTWWDNQRVAVGGPLAFSQIQKGLNLARIAGGNPTSIITSLGVQREFYGLMTQQVRYVEPEKNSYSTGFRALDYNGMPIIADIDAPYGTMYILDESTMKVFSDQDWHFLDADGMTLRQVSGFDKFEAVLARYMNMGANRRNNQVVLTGITVDTNPDAGF